LIELDGTSTDTNDSP